MAGRLGKKTKKGERFKAVAEQYPGEGPAEVLAAYDDLTRAAFSVWIRLSASTDDELRSGRGNLATLLGYSQRRCNEVLLQLERKGYISFITNGPWRPTTVVIERRPAFDRKCRIVRLANAVI